MKHEDAGLSAKEYRESNCGSDASLFMCGKDLITPFSLPRGYCEVRAVLFNYQGRSSKQFTPLWRSVRLVQTCLCAGKT